jgi:endogenous inhibitor of DNA gyrase (YacG/DUF329 family)
MPLSRQLGDKLLTFNCPHCHRALTKNGAWFMAMSRFKCAGCGRDVPMGYADKMVLFDKHAHLIGKKS